jgi:hypothetical protein
LCPRSLFAALQQPVKENMKIGNTVLAATLKGSMIGIIRAVRGSNILVELERLPFEDKFFVPSQKIQSFNKKAIVVLD